MGALTEVRGQWLMHQPSSKTLVGAITNGIRIERIGDTVDPYCHLVLMSGAWENGMPLSDVEIRSVEAVTPASMFS
ncbi:UNVERIFIED_ORG: hypothetical protein M2435_004623 [Rhizobium sophorae]|uniref:hypothetical protein n=1 Tax=Rhizobium TaxID=379 RepID=UPI0010306BC4|nr:MULTISPECIES: hypothetical protein [Rhizobium]MBB4524627.1 hypothetical protein [Rhizobium leguminosarum]MDH6661702.1 hypothetical protein [Rhizobium sophorae]TBE47771.1 hypothetical protein ELH06_00530 [Rhizobium ruizarguesonis]